ncbi:hypothetical protein DFJ77DRAFT_440363 [Powellomyces hirtus]|nr:hypothetical protein DFJ77DRAFT_440363 [Powellomyces hirtus]
MSAAAAQTPTRIVRRYMPRLARRVHPDLFANDPTAQKQNSTSLQALNEIVSAAFPQNHIPNPSLSTRENGVLRQSEAAHSRLRDTSLAFFCKVMDTGANAHAAETARPIVVSHILSAKKPGLPTCQLLLKSKGKAVMDPLLAGSFLDLCEKAGVTVSPEDRDALTAALEKAVGGPQLGKTQKDVNKQRQKPQSEFPSIFRAAASAASAPSFAANPNGRKTPHPSAHLQSTKDVLSFAHFWKHLTKPEATHALRRLRDLPQPLFAALQNHNVLVARQWRITDGGVLVVPWDFEIVDMEVWIRSIALLLPPSPIPTKKHPRKCWSFARRNHGQIDAGTDPHTGISMSFTPLTCNLMGCFQHFGYFEMVFGGMHADPAVDFVGGTRGADGPAMPIAKSRHLAQLRHGKGALGWRLALVSVKGIVKQVLHTIILRNLIAEAANMLLPLASRRPSFIVFIVDALMKRRGTLSAKRGFDEVLRKVLKETTLAL